MLPIWAIIERDLRKYIRNTRLIAISILLPLIQLVVVGYAVGGQIRNVDVALVDLDGGPGADDLRQKFAAIEANARTFHILLSTTVDRAVQAAREGTVAAAIIIPEGYSRKVSQGNRPELGLVLDNTDPFVSVALTQKMTELVIAVNSPEVDPRRAAQVALEIVEIFPYIEYIQYLLPGSVTLAIYVSCVIGGGVLYMDDKIQGFHEGYLVTPVTKLQLLTGMTVSGTAKAVFAGTCVTFAGAYIAGVADRLTLETIGLLIGLNSLVAAALISMITLIMVRVKDPMLPRAVFTVFNTLLFFPSGAIYPIYGFPEWLKVVSKIDPFTYAVHGFRGLLLKGVGAPALVGDMIFLTGFSIVCCLGAYVLFPRRL